MAPPDDLESFKTNVIDVICDHLRNGNGNVLVHCRGGVGRAGLVTCCVLSELCSFPSDDSSSSGPKLAIEFVRKRRDKRCVESRKQEDFVAKYF